MASREENIVQLFKEGHAVNQLGGKFGEDDTTIESIIRTWMNAYERGVLDSQPREMEDEDG